MSRYESAILKSVIYASLFDYPLTLEQLHQTLIATTMTREQILATYDNSVRLRSVIEYRDGFFFPTGRADLIAERCEREARSHTFIDRHRLALRWICSLPFTRMVALSGSIAHFNLEPGGDLDLFVITGGRHVWTVTVAIIVLTRLLNVRKVMCANFVMSDAHLVLPQHDLFTANQVLHLKPLIGAHVLDGFVAANPFVQRWYPNRSTRAQLPGGFQLSRWNRLAKTIAERILAPVSPAVESFCRRLYARHLERRAASWRSPEQVALQLDYLKLHTRSHRQSVLDRFDERVEEALGQGERAAIA
ncbi:MAG TPA: hypothetical protein VH583_09715 [Vicinamibacterales bacterium]